MRSPNLPEYGGLEVLKARSAVNWIVLGDGIVRELDAGLTKRPYCVEEPIVEPLVMG